MKQHNMCGCWCKAWGGICSLGALVAERRGKKKKDLQLALQVLAFLVGPPGVEPGTNGL